ncbi:T cell receptor beta chain MC.7.G5-like [Chelmon rostratus]|uniref:T cell receptor beta chain MC.7.G5-like n=1 Tax=Chelmon rostratus TaxID=109905 RepID=UPI001BEAB2F0|nr:T cell receptor beta chain MC.7.G5-like [Chelmon rostratus]
MMSSRFIVAIITVSWFKGVYSSKEKQVIQTPNELFMKPNGEFTLSFTHKMPSYNTILWYQRSAGDTSLKLIGYMYYKSPTIETSYQSQFNVSGDGQKTAYLHILNPRHPEDSGEYFGAASMHSNKDSGNNGAFILVVCHCFTGLDLTLVSRMPPALYTFGFLLLMFTREVESVIFEQSSPQVVKEGTKEVRINCSHNDSGLQVMLWYQHKQSSRSMSLIGYTVLQGEPSYEVQFKDRFQIKRDDTLRGSLIVQAVNPSDSAVYFCAARNSYDPAYFGSGTRLTVLESGREISRPNVAVLRPSPKECRNQKEDIRKKTLVCVADGFYPDHVSVFWEVNGYNVTKGVATDNAAVRPQGKDFYKITSRLRVSAEEWFTPSSEFKCIVSFFNGTGHENHPASIFGDEATATGVTRERYLRISQTAKLSYGVFIVKSCIYGAFVAFLVWKLQGSAGKQNN